MLLALGAVLLVTIAALLDSGPPVPSRARVRSRSH